MTNEIAAALNDVREALDESQAAIFDLKKAYTVVQEHHGLKPEDSPYIRQGIKAQTRIVNAIKSLTAIESQLADAKPVAWQCQRASYRDEAGTFGGWETRFYEKKPNDETGWVKDVSPLYAHPPIAQLAGPGDERGLLPCPFCGSLEIDPEGWSSTDTKGPACDDCGASAGEVSKNHAENIAAWNQRTTLRTPAVPAGVTVRELCEAIHDMDSIICHHTECCCVICDDHAATIAFAQEQIRKGEA